ncbi:MAG TPA: hypothetical protein VD902_17065 [Symbiobacteriaceae bacterium]|nr:hypothetical protein [Symbiobacteriaceae bacterium]
MQGRLIHVCADLSWQVLDEDEFHENAQRLGYPDWVVSEAWRGVGLMIDLVERRAFPFDGAAEAFGRRVLGTR